MIEDFSTSPKNSLFYFLVLFLTSVYGQTQNSETLLEVEKIYLHTDRNIYFVGEDLWYKAYDVRAFNNILFDQSNILYVELISADSKIIARNKTKLEMGLGNGDFQLQDSLGIKPGKYQLRAYTNWNRNFGDDFVFKKEFEVIDVFKINSVSDNEKRTANDGKTIKTIDRQNKISVDFFPEGGSLLENVASVVGFKVVDNNGNPIDIKGEIYDSDNELLATFQSVHDGMGKFQLLPLQSKRYFAKIKTETGIEIRQELPKTLKQGYLLSYRNLKGKHVISVTTNEATLAQNPNQELKIVCKARGISYLEITQTLTEPTLSFELSKEKTPEGISQITLYDATNKPQSERLVYIEKEHYLEVQLSTDKAVYQPNEKVTINVSSRSKEGVLKSASYSMSVTDANGVDDQGYESNICSYFMMESDIRGKVIHPAYYFDVINPKRLEHLDNVLLTQGWRDFVWKTIPKVDKKNSYKVEKGITVSGRVKQLFADKPLVNNNLTLALMSKKKQAIFSTLTDTVGYFRFENLLFTGKADMYLNTRDEKGKARGEIVLDSIVRSPMNVKYIKEENILTASLNQILKNVSKKFTAFGVKPENILKEVEVIAKSKRPFVVPHGIARFTYTADEKTANYFDVFDIFQEHMPLVKSGIMKLYSPTEGEFLDEPEVEGYYIDDNKASLAEVIAISPYEIEKIEFVDEFMPGIYIYTNRYKNLGKPKNAVHSIKKELEGYYNARVFYAPNPELDNKSAVRNTIYWNPYVHPDKAGSVSVYYYNSAVETKIKVALEGITATGIPVVRNVYYNIKK